MKRGSGLRRLTPLVAKVPFQRGGQLARSGLASTTRPARKAMRKVAAYTGPSRQIRELVVVRDKGRCVICGQGARVVHHRQPRGRGGASAAAINLPSNLISLCLADHDRVESFRADAYVEGYLVRRPLNPARVPVYLYGFGKAYLRDDGSRELVAA